MNGERDYNFSKGGISLGRQYGSGVIMEDCHEAGNALGAVERDWEVRIDACGDRCSGIVDLPTRCESTYTSKDMGANAL